MEDLSEDGKFSVEISVLRMALSQVYFEEVLVWVIKQNFF